ncbi:MAG: glycosyltransferase family 2 protein [Clostridia bacterium]|nr:glycosyltransferase family 2 protein [Clostridia bacterium]
MTQTNGKVSIIMAAYNAEKTIRQAIESVLAQTYSDFELLVVNDCSKDQTQAIVEAYSQRDERVKLIVNPKNMGVSHTRLNGLKAATGVWIAVLDSDDAWMPEKLEKQMVLQKQTGAALLYTASQFIDGDGNKIDWILSVPEKVDYKTLLKQNILSNSSSLCRKELYQKYYAIDDGMHEDFTLWLNILKTGEVAYGVNEPLLIYRVSTNSKSGNKIKAAKMNWNTYRAVGLNLFEALYYEIWYTINGLLKYRKLK